jgi:glucosamine-6-phosphate deaminase
MKLWPNQSPEPTAVAAALTGSVTPDVPASVLQLHPDCEFILDPAATERLP